MATSGEVRRRFFQHLWKDLQVIWPVISGLIGFQLVLGAVIGFLERWSVSETIYFTFVNSHNRLWGFSVEAHYLADDCLGEGYC